MRKSLRWVLLMAVVWTGFLSLEGCSGLSPPPTSQPPTTPKAFYDLKALTSNGLSLELDPTQLWYDEDQQGMRVDTMFVRFPGYPQNISSVARNSTTNFFMNGLCRPTGGYPFEPIFSWVPSSTYRGQVLIGDRLCDEWAADLPKLGPAVLYVLANTSSPAIPVQVILPAPAVNGDVVNATYLFSEELVVGSVDPEVWDEWNPTCETPLVCEAGETVEEKVYLFHSVNDFQLVNTNVADQLGDTIFVCLALETGLFDYFEWVSEYSVMLNSTWGEYAFCNFGQCLDGSVDRVGREASESLGPLTGQCTNNTAIGNWYSLPPYNSSLCSEEYANGTIGINGTEWFGCGWNVLEKVKTINGSCLEGHGFYNACIADGDIPFPSASRIWTQAFASEDPSLGGCPAISTEVTSSPTSTQRQRPLPAPSMEDQAITRLKSLTPSYFLRPADGLSDQRSTISIN